MGPGLHGIVFHRYVLARFRRRQFARSSARICCAEPALRLSLNPVLRNRVITALILAPIVLGVVFLSNIQTFAVFFWFVIAFGCYEWAGLLGLEARWARFGYVAGFGALALGLAVFPAAQTWVLWAAAGVFFWAAAITAVLSYPRSASVVSHRAVLALVGWIILSAALGQSGGYPRATSGVPGWDWAGVLLMVWAADIGAYFAGKKFGRRLLAPKVSPGKTWEGVLGGYLLALGVSGVAVVLWQPHALLWLLVTVVLIAISIFGDLFESVLKRATGIKDSGTLLPGHGGMLDPHLIRPWQCSRC